jgi:hypothetical protein
MLYCIDSKQIGNDMKIIPTEAILDTVTHIDDYVQTATESDIKELIVRAQSDPGILSEAWLIYTTILEADTEST